MNNFHCFLYLFIFTDQASRKYKILWELATELRLRIMRRGIPASFKQGVRQEELKTTQEVARPRIKPCGPSRPITRQGKRKHRGRHIAARTNQQIIGQATHVAARRQERVLGISLEPPRSDLGQRTDGGVVNVTPSEQTPAATAPQTQAREKYPSNCSLPESRQGPLKRSFGTKAQKHLKTRPTRTLVENTTTRGT